MANLVEQPVVLAVGAHPDNVELLSAGTLALLKQKGWRVALLSLTSGDPAAPSRSNGGVGQVRREDARGAAAVLDADCYCLELPDFSVVYGDEICRRVTALIRAVRPALVLTHGPQDATPDHEETSRILRQACFAAPVADYQTRGIPGGQAEPTGRIPHLYYFDPFELIDCLGRLVEATLIVDIAPTMDTKEKMLAHYVTPAAAADEFRGIDWYLDEVRAWGRRRGEQVGCTYGEGFRQHLGSPYPRENLLKEVLGDSVHVVNSH